MPRSSRPARSRRSERSTATDGKTLDEVRAGQTCLALILPRQLAERLKAWIYHGREECIRPTDRAQAILLAATGSSTRWPEYPRRLFSLKTERPVDWPSESSPSPNCS